MNLEAQPLAKMPMATGRIFAEFENRWCSERRGHPDRMLVALQDGCSDFERVNTEESPGSPASIAAIYSLRQCLGRVSLLYDIDRTLISSRVRELSYELGQRLLNHFRDSEHADNYLARGVVIGTDLDGTWNTHCPDYEIPL